MSQDLSFEKMYLLARVQENFEKYKVFREAEVLAWRKKSVEELLDMAGKVKSGVLDAFKCVGNLPEDRTKAFINLVSMLDNCTDDKVSVSPSDHWVMVLGVFQDAERETFLKKTEAI